MGIYAEEKSYLPVIAPVAFTTSAIESAVVDLNNTQDIEFLVMFGAMTSDSSDTVTITVEAMVEATSASTSTETAIAFNYRLSAAVATDTMGAITAATATGTDAVNASTGDNCVLVVTVDPAVVAAVSGARWIRLVATPSDAVASGVISAIAVITPRYPKNVNLSST